MIQSFVSLIIPAFNEENTIGDVINSTADVMNKYGLPYEIIVVDDCSTDNTQIVASLTGKATVFSNKLNSGKGYCLRRAAEHAQGEFIITLDSDGEHNPYEIPRLLNPLREGIDIVAGSRFLENAKHVTSNIHQLGNDFFNIAIMGLTGRLVTDSQTGFRAMTKDALTNSICNQMDMKSKQRLLLKV